MCLLYFLPSHLLIFPFISPLPAKGKFRELGYLSKSNKLPLCTIAKYMSAYYFPTSSSSMHRRGGAQGTSRYSVVLFSSLFAMQLHELFTHTIQSIFGRQLLISSWALLWCSLLQYPNASQILMYLLLLFTVRSISFILVIRSYETGIEVKNISGCIPTRRHQGFDPRLYSTLPLAAAAPAPAFCKYDSGALLGTQWCLHCQPHWNTLWQSWRGNIVFQRQGTSSTARAGNWMLSCLELVLSCHKAATRLAGGQSLVNSRTPFWRAFLDNSYLYNTWAQTFTFSFQTTFPIYVIQQKEEFAYSKT